MPVMCVPVSQGALRCHSHQDRSQAYPEAASRLMGAAPARTWPPASEQTSAA